MTVSASQLRENQQILVSGVLSFSRLSKLIEGKELADRVASEKQRGIKFPTDKPHTTITIVDAQVLPADPQAATLEETYVHERIFAYKKGDNAGKLALTVDNKSSYLPAVLAPSATEAGTYEQVQLERDLASGIPVTLVLNIYGSKDYANKGIGLQQVVLHEAVRYYSSAGGAAVDALKARGIIVNGTIENVAAPATGSADETAAASAAFTAEAERNGFGVPANTGVTAGGFAFPTPGAQGTAPVAPAASPFPIAGQAPATASVAQQIAQAPLVAQVPVQNASGETPDQELARLRQQLAEQQAATVGAVGPSAFDVAPAVPVAAAAPGPWDVPGAGPAAVQG
jgi:hypothetical protein